MVATAGSLEAAENGTRDKGAKFFQLAPKRVNRAIRDIRLVTNLANRRNYHYTDDQARRIVRALQKELDALKAAFSGADDSGTDSFRL